MNDQSTSSFGTQTQDVTYAEVELLPNRGVTSDTYRVRIGGKLYFLKRLKLNYQLHPLYVLAFRKEFEIGHSLEHPNLVTYERMDNAHDILMEFVNGDTLKEFIALYPKYFTHSRNVHRFLSEMLSCLQYLHEHQVVHLDIKPDNILVTRVGRKVKIVDLGFSYADAYDNTRGHSPEYAAPEQLNNQPVDGRTDLFSLGRVLAYIQSNVRGAAIDSSLINRLTAETPDDRYDSASEVIRLMKRKQWIRRTTLCTLMALFGWGIWFQQSRHKLTYAENPVAYVESLNRNAHPGGITPEEASSGIYIRDWKGNLVQPERWDTLYRASAIALVTDSFSAQIALHDQARNVEWGCDGFVVTQESTEEGLPHDTPGRVMRDLEGMDNTNHFIVRYQQQDSTALHIVYNYRFPDGNRGYLPALGELNSVAQHIGEINTALQRCYGTSLDGYYWTSSQDYTEIRIWTMNVTAPVPFSFANFRNHIGKEEYEPPLFNARAFGYLRQEQHSPDKAVKPEFYNR